MGKITDSHCRRRQDVLDELLFRISKDMKYLVYDLENQTVYQRQNNKL